MKKFIRETAEEILQEYTGCYSEEDEDCLVKMLENLAFGVAKEIFEEIEKSFIEYYDKTITYSSPTLPLYIREAAGFSLNEMFMKIAELKKKYIGKDTNVTTKETEDN